MKHMKTALLPALLALSLFGANLARADVTEPDNHTKVDPPPPDPAPEPMPPDNHTKVDPPPEPAPMPPDNHTKVDPPPTPPGPTPQPPRHGGGGGGTHGKRVFLCVIGNQRYYVRYAAECRGPRVVYQQPRVIYAQPKKRVRTVRYAAPCNCQAPVVSYGGSYGGGDIVIGGGGTRFIGSPAAVAQARRRANRQAQYDYANGGGYGYSDGGGSYEQAPVVRRKAKRVRRVRVQAYNPYPVYDPGVVIHYGPAIMKDGAY